MLRPHPLRSLVAILALALLVAIPATARAASDESTAYQINPGHTGFASGGSLDRPPLRARWSRKLGTSTSYPLVAGGRVFVTAYDSGHAGGTLSALDVATGTTLWSRAVTGYAYITYDAGRVFIADNSGSVVAVSAVTGATLWIRTLPEPFTLMKPVAADGVLYVDVAWSGGSLYALNESDGSTRWTARFYDGASPALDGSFVYLSDDYEGATAGFSRADGTQAWSGTKQCFVGSGNVVTDGARVIGPYNTSCGAVVDASTGRALDSTAASAWPASAGDVAVVLNGSTLQARSLSSGVLLWQFAGDGTLRSAPVIVNETVYAGSASGTLFALDLRTGSQIWSGAIASGATAGDAGMAAGSGVLVVPAGGTITALESVRSPRAGLDLRILSGPDGPTTSRGATLTLGSTGGVATTCRLDGGAWLPCLGSASYSDLADGPHMFEARSVDAEGTVALAARGWSIETTAPTATLGYGTEGRTRWRSAAFNFSADDDFAAFDCRLDGGPWEPCGSSGSGTKSYDGLVDGQHRFEVRARDAVGNVQAQPATRTWTIDNTPPHTTITSGPQGTTSSTSATFEFVANEPATFSCRTPWGWTACSSPYTISGVPSGDQTLVVVATDVAGNVEPVGATWSWSVGAGPPSYAPPPDTTPPHTQITAGPPSVTSSTSASFVMSASEPSWLECRFDAGAWAQCDPQLQMFDVADGTHAFEARAVDGSGNVDPTPARVTWTVDTRAPTAHATIDPSSPSSAEPRFELSADEGFVTYECALDAGDWTPCASGVSYGRLAPGDHVFAVRATDAAGNRDTWGSTLDVHIATAPPAPTSSAPATTPPPNVDSPRTPARTTPDRSTVLPSAQLDATALATVLADRTASLLLRSTRRALRTKRLTVSLTTTGPVTIAIKVTSRRDGHGTTVATAKTHVAAAGRHTVRLRLTAAGRRALAATEPLELRIRATVTPATGARGVATSSAGV